MFKRMSLAVSAMLMTLWLPSPTFAQGTPGEQGAVAVSPATSPERSAAEKQATGTVVSVSENKKTLVVEANGKKIIFWVAERAVEDLSRVKRGDRVTVRYTDESGQLTVQQVIKG
ncbi:MAG TPA: hypothetical protein VIG69_09035 [Candidatus Methylomirabilis sp.]|jgi:hypothetical protein